MLETTLNDAAEAAELPLLFCYVPLCVCVCLTVCVCVCVLLTKNTADHALTVVFKRFFGLNWSQNTERNIGYKSRSRKSLCYSFLQSETPPLNSSHNSCV